MASIVSSIKLVSSNLFPNPVNFTVQASETVNGDAAFSTAVLENTTGTPTQRIYGLTTDPVGVSNVVYVYLHSSPDNAAGAVVLVNITGTADQTISTMKLLPGDFAWFPFYGEDAGMKIELENTSATNTASVNYFFGERG